MRTSSLIPILALACNPSNDTAETGDSSVVLEPFDVATAERLDAALTAILDEHDAAGIQAAVAMPGYERWLGWGGMADLEAEEVMAAGHVSKAGSITKPLVSALVLQAVDDGVLSLDDNLSSWVPDHPWGSEVTLRHLLQHSSGIPEYAGVLEIAGDQDEAWELVDLVALVEDQPLLSEPGATFDYANTNYVLLAMALEAAGDDSWTDRAGALFGSVDGGQLEIPGADWGEVVPGYCMLPGGTPYEHDTGTNFVDYWHPSAIGPAGNLVADAEGLAAWGQALWVEESLVSSDAIVAMSEDVITVSTSLDYGLGLVIDHGQDPERWFHNGAVTGYSAWLEGRPTDGAVVAIMSNSWLVDGGSFSSDWLWDARDTMWEALDGTLSTARDRRKVP